MRFSTKGRYAVSAMLHLAMHNDAGPVPLSEISDCQSISTSYVDQIFSHLRKAGLIHGISGPGGGYRLARPAEQISIGEIFAAMEAPAAGAHGSGLDAVVWDGLKNEIASFLGTLTLADFVNRPGVREALERQYGRAGNWRCETCGAVSSRGE